MTIQDKQTLIRLLALYCDDLMDNNLLNIQAVKEAERAGKSRWQAPIKYGVKAQYDHARIIMTKLLVEVGKEVKPSYQI